MTSSILRHFSANANLLTPFDFRRELDMEAYLVENPNVFQLDPNHFADADIEIIDQQVRIENGGTRQPKHGIVDVLIQFDPDTVGVVELKVNRLCTEHLEQLEGYLGQKDRILSQVGALQDGNSSPSKLIGILVGKSVDPDLAQKILNGHEVNGIRVAALTLQRYRNNNGEVFVVTDTYFCPNKKDYSKYEFEGSLYGKGRLVLAVIHAYFRKNGAKSLGDLTQEFPGSLQKSKLGVLTSLGDAQKIERD